MALVGTPGPARTSTIGTHRLPGPQATARRGTAHRSHGGGAPFHPRASSAAGANRAQARAQARADPLSRPARPPRLRNPLPRALDLAENPERLRDLSTQPRPRPGFSPGTLRSPGEGLAWLGGLVLALSSFTSWYTVQSEGYTASVTAWHTGVVGKLLFLVGSAGLALLVLYATS